MMRTLIPLVFLVGALLGAALSILIYERYDAQRCLDSPVRAELCPLTDANGNSYRVQ